MEWLNILNSAERSIWSGSPMAFEMSKDSAGSEHPSEILKII